MKPTEKILIIDDEEGMRMNLRALLEDIGYQVDEAGDGAEGLERCARARPDLVLLDLRMPVMDGLEVCTRLKADEATRAIPVIFLSGVLDSHEKVKAFQAGAVDYVTKPFHFREVEARVRNRLELVRAQQRLETQNRDLQEALGQTATLNHKLVAVNERLRQSEAVKSRFLATMRNEINNPLSSIRGLGMQLEKGGIPPGREPAIGALIAGAAEDLDFQIRNIFCAAELEAGEATPVPAQVDAAAVVRDVLADLDRQARARAVTVDLEGAAGGFCTDPGMLRAITANLVSNAIKFSHEGGRVQVRLRREEPDLTLEVEDAGIGIRPEDQALAFEPFRQLEAGLTRAHQGQGLGLSVVRALVDLLGGQISVASEPGAGARFTCTIPEQPAQDPGLTASADGAVLFFDDPEEIG